MVGGRGMIPVSPQTSFPSIVKTLDGPWAELTNMVIPPSTQGMMNFSARTCGRLLHVRLPNVYAPHRNSCLYKIFGSKKDFP